MLFLLITNPAPKPPSSVRGDRQRFWRWCAPLQENGTVRSIYGRVGRGAVAILDVPDHETLHRLLNEWSDIIPAEFQVYPLVEAGDIKAFLDAPDSATA